MGIVNAYKGSYPVFYIVFLITNVVDMKSICVQSMKLNQCSYCRLKYRFGFVRGNAGQICIRELTTLKRDKLHSCPDIKQTDRN